MLSPQAATSDVFSKLSYEERHFFISRLQSVWTRTVQTESIEWSNAAVLKLVRQHAEMAKNQKTFFCKLVHDEFAGNSDPLVCGADGLPKLHRAILKMVDFTFTLWRPLLEQHGFSNDILGYAKMDNLLRQLVEANNNTLVVEMLAKTWFSLYIGSANNWDMPDAVAKKYFGTTMAIWSGLMTSKDIVLIATSQSYLHHLALLPLQRRKCSIPRTIAFVDALLKPLFSMMKSPSGKDADGAISGNTRVVWLLGATAVSEASWAREGLFEDAAALASEDMHVHLIGDGPFDGEWPCGKRVHVFAHTWEEMHAGKIEDPTFVCCCNTGIGTLDPRVVELWLPILVDLMLYPGYQVGVPVVLTCRCEAEVQGEKDLLKRIGAKPFFPSSSKQHVRNLYSGMAADPYIEYDDNGWLTFLCGSKLKRDELLKLACNAETLCQEVVESRAATASTDKSTEINNGTDAREDDTVQKTPAVFWGILDLKYDPTKPLADRIKVLETGDGRASKFSGYGAAIKENFQQENKLEDSIHRSVMVESKKLTHDIVNDCGYAHIQPRQGCYPKVYTEKLAGQIRNELSLGVDDYCILKLSNRARGAGVIPAHVSDLDENLKALLTPPQDLSAWFKSQDPQVARKITWGCFEEQLRHWWSNECPCFLVESFCMSRPLWKEIDGSWRQFDGTMRVGFSLHGDPEPELPDGWELDRACKLQWVGTEERMHPFPPQEEVMASLTKPYDGIFPYGLCGGRPLRVQWLGGYWKLPVEDVDSPDLRGRVVSVAKLGTAPVVTVDLHEVYAALGDSVQRMFNFRTATQHSNVMKRYASFPELGAFSVARLACSMRTREYRKSVQLLGLARDKILKLTGGPRDLTLSYIERNLGVAEALKGNNWESAEDFFRKSIEAMPTNATSQYLLGMSQLSKGMPNEAIASMEKSLYLDPDFKAPFVNIGVAWLQLKRYAETIEISDACLRRHPQTPQCLFNKGLAMFSLAFLEEQKSKRGHIATELRTNARAALLIAKEHLSSVVWTEREDRILVALENDSAPIVWLVVDLPCNGCRFLGWRP